MAGVGESTAVKVSVIGKIKTILQMVALVLLLIRDPVGPLDVWLVGMVLLWVAVILTLWSMVAYLQSAWPALRGDAGGGS